MLDQLLKTNDPDKKWPAEEMLRALGLRVRSAHSFSHHQPPTHLSLQELFDLVISDDDDPRPGYIISPMLDRRNIGMKAFREAVAALNAADLQTNIKEIWKPKSEKIQRSLRVVGFERYTWSKPLNRAGMCYSATRSEAVKKKSAQANSSSAPCPGITAKRNKA